MELPEDQANFRGPHSWPTLLSHDKMYTASESNPGPLVVAGIDRLHCLTGLIKFAIN